MKDYEHDALVVLFCTILSALIIAFCLFSCGCAASRKEFKYEDQLVIVKETPSLVHKDCASPDALCCYEDENTIPEKATPTIFVRSDHPSCLTHEFCHWLLGRNDPECDGYDWDELDRRPGWGGLL